MVIFSILLALSPILLAQENSKSGSNLYSPGPQSYSPGSTLKTKHKMYIFSILLAILLAILPGELVQVWSRKWFYSPGYSPRRILLAFTEAYMVHVWQFIAK